MRTTLILATFVASVLAIFAAIETRPGEALAAGPRPRLAVIDVSFIFKNHAGLMQTRPA